MPPRGRDHPRSRGVYPASVVMSRFWPGSSPLARGLRGRSVLSSLPHRIIPARAGFTQRRHLGNLSVWDHPRSRGVYPSDWQTWTLQDGSSPLARGLPSQRGGRPGRAGIIPARAGFTVGRGHIVQDDADHPRSRGVYPTVAELNKGLHGSSPLARGLPSRPRAGHVCHRIIPARAGFT